MQLTVTFTWYEGGLKPARPAVMADNEPFDGNGILFIGDKGALSSPGWGGRPRLLPLSRDKEYQRPPPSLPRWLGRFRVGSATAPYARNAVHGAAGFNSK